MIKLFKLRWCNRITKRSSTIELDMDEVLDNIEFIKGNHNLFQLVSLKLTQKGRKVFLDEEY